MSSSYHSISAPDLCNLSRHPRTSRDCKEYGGDIRGEDATETTRLIRSSSTAISLAGLAPANAPTDVKRFVCLSFCFLGMSTMLPWNFMISVTSFWMYKFRNVSLDYLPQGNQDSADPIPTPLQIAFPSYLAIASNVPGAITTLLHSFLGQRLCVRKRIFWSLCILFSAFVILLLLSIPCSDLWQVKFMHTVLLIVVLTNVGVNVLQGALFGVSGRFPPLYAGCVMTGQALGGVVPAAAAIGMTSLDIEAKLLGPVCFGVILAFVAVGIFIFSLISKNRFFLYYAESQGVLTGRVEDSNHDAEVDKISYKRILRRSWTYFLTGYVNYATSLCVFPAITSLVEPETPSHWTHLYFTPVASVLLFNVGDLLGRSLATWLCWPGPSKLGRISVLVFTLLRIGLVPLFLLCNASPLTRHHKEWHTMQHHLGYLENVSDQCRSSFLDHFLSLLFLGPIQNSFMVLFPSSLIFCILNAILALTNGYLGNICMIQSPRRAKFPGESEATSILTNSAIVLGIGSGSALSLVMRQFL